MTAGKFEIVAARNSPVSQIFPTFDMNGTEKEGRNKGTVEF